MQDRPDRPAFGLFGKLPARGDFVRAGLPGDFVAAWDHWLEEVIGATRARLGAAWLPAFLEAPVWRFALAPGLCGAASVSGLWLPSVDRVGRYYPLTLAAITRCSQSSQAATKSPGSPARTKSPRAGSLPNRPTVPRALRSSKPRPSRRLAAKP